MKALWYVTKRSMVNQIKKAIKKPVTYLILAVALLYVFLFGSLFIGWRESGSFTSERSLVTILTVGTVFTFFSNFVTYAKKKGIIFKPSHAHFIFTAPINPKVILLMGAMKNFLLGAVLIPVFFFAEMYVFQIGFFKAFLLSVVVFLLETILEGSLIIFLYANERLSTKITTVLCRGIYVFLFAVVAVGVFYFQKYGIHFESIYRFVDYPIIQMLPVVGWNIALYRLILLGPTTGNVICSILYLLSVAGMFYVAKTMKCTGEYYEDAAKFADDYAEFYKRNKSGEMVFTVGQKKKFKKTKIVQYKGTGAKAIFYRQLQEYKKERFFIFGGMTVAAIVADVVMIWFLKGKFNAPPEVLLLGLIAYITFVATGYTGKWEKELKTHYLYLIPDSPIRKLWYATLMEHIRSLIDGIVLCVPIGLVWKMPIGYIVMSVVIYAVLQANKLYMRVFAESVIGLSLGTTGRQFVYMLFQSAILGMGITFGVVTGIFLGMFWVFPILILYCMLMMIFIMLLASARFEKMEQAV